MEMDAQQINEIIRSQEADYQEINQIFTNIKKDSTKRKTAKYISERRTRLIEIFTRTSTNHARLEGVKELSSHKYVTSDVFSVIKNMYTQALGYLEQCEKSLQATDDLYIPEDMECQQDKATESSKITVQIMRIKRLHKKLQLTDQAVLENEQHSYLQSLVPILQSRWHEIENAHFKIVMEDSTVDHAYFRNGMFEQIEDEFEQTNKRLIMKLNENKQPERHHKIKLPTINLPIFTGAYESWSSFYDLFVKVIHEDPSLSSTEKMQYLKTHVRGDAGKLIKHLPVCEANYEIAWSIITKRYKNQRIIITKHIDNILNLQKIYKPTAESLRNLHDTINENLEALKSQDIDISTWDPILTRILSKIWDAETNEKYEHQLTDPSQPQKFSEMLEFLEKRFKCLENTSKQENRSFKPNHVPYQTFASTKYMQNKVTCWFCQSNTHDVYKCTKFMELSAQDRIKTVKEKKICKNCLMHGTEQECYSSKKCMHCDKSGHHSYLHRDLQYNPTQNKKWSTAQGDNKEWNPNKPNITTPSTSKPNYYHANKKATNTVSSTNGATSKTTILATALVRVKAMDGTSHLLRVLCDQGSEAAFCTEEVAQLLSYPRSRVQTEIIGIADEKPKTSNYAIEAKLKSRFSNDYELPVTLIILPKLTSALPNKSVPQIESQWLKDKPIADPTYYKRGPIDIILGAEEYSKLLLDGVQNIQDGMIAQNTKIGWILSGILNDNTTTMKVLSMMTRTSEVQQLTKFWELEEVPTNYQLSKNDQECEKYYNETTIRNPDGTYTVRLPFKNASMEYGDSRRKAAARLLQLEQKFTKNKNLQTNYQGFLNEYLKMGHMKKIPKTKNYQGKYYFPHQPVINENSLTTKLRVVFDGSSKASANNISLNDNMLTGPKLQQDLTAILLRWRKHKIAFMADIEKMYRFIKIHEQDLKYQRILWRESPNQPIDEYELTTVTYGTTAAPYLAIKTLQQLAIDEKDKFPVASKVTLEDFYVDDVLSGGSCISSAKKLQKDLILMLQAGGFKLKKWSSNNAELLESIPENNKDDKMLKIPLDETRKSLGILWSPLEDSFCFEVTINKKENPTKRFILSEIAKLFDPLGWLAPIVINMKLIIQELWTNGSEWDQPVEGNIKERWTEIQAQLKTIESIKIRRWCHIGPESKIELHGFCDASEKAYGAVVYCRVKNSENAQYDVTLLQAKSKVAPKKQKTTLPRLELCAAQLLTHLMDKVVKAMNSTNPNIYCWTDSMIALGWIKGEAERWKTFVANRVSEIQKMLPQAKWNHVVSDQNPADVVSRGITPNKLQDHTLWWNGPEWLRSNDKIPVTKTMPEICEEIKHCHHIITNTEPRNELLQKFASFQKTVRVLTYCLRWKYKPSHNNNTLSCAEINATTTKILIQVQQEAFKTEYKTIKNQQQLNKGNKLANLDPFVDTDGLIRVGGRLQRSNLPYDQKHPIVLPYDHHITSSIINDAHLKTLHGGNNMTLAYIRQKYWILSGKQAVKKYIRACVKCIRFRSSTAQQKMGILPKPRVTESFPFSHTGVDYAGPIQVRAMKGRGHKSYKGYIAIFVCLATKAIHLEVVGDLTTESCIAALRRVMARRGPISHIYSDNGTNFVGAANFLYKEILAITQSDTFQTELTNIGTQWHFIPPSSPHFGGIWEAGVRSMKHHLRRVIGEQTLTYEELTTFVQQTEACLNSRPLCAQSENINDNVVLTPSHFLIGREAVGIPDPLSNLNTDLLNRWKQIQRMKKDFWKSWSKDYLHQLQQRYKWKTNQENLRKGTLVLIKDDNISPSKWPLAKITELHTGDDGLTRVVTLQKASGTTQKRSIHTLIPLPIDSNPEVETKPNQKAFNSAVTAIQQKKHHRKQRTAKGLSQWFTFIVMIMQLFCLTASTYTVKSIEPGFYVEHLGTANIDRGTFRIETTFERKHIEQDLIKIKETTEQYNQLCDKTQVTHCKQFYYHLLEKQSKFERIQEYLTELNQTRKKRGLMGQFLTSVFGVNDEVYQDIDTLNKNQDKLINAANHQTKLMLTTVSQINETETRVTQKLQNYQIKLNQIIDYIHETDHWYTKLDTNKVNIQVIETYQLADNYITDIMQYYSGLMDINVNKATVYSILTPKNVSNVIASANKKLPGSLKIMQNLLLETRMTENETHIQIYAYFPIQDISKYELMHITPIPKKIGKQTFQNIDVEKTYIGLDYNKELYFDLSHDEFKSCLQKLGRFLCFPGVVKNMQSHQNCMVDHLFTNHTKTKCLTKTFELTSNILWKRLVMENTWVYITKQPTTVSVVCDGQRQEAELKNVGVIKITDNCLIKTSRNVLAAQRSMSVQVGASYIKQIDFNITTIPLNHTIFNITHEEVIESSHNILQNVIQSEQTLQTDLNNTVWKQLSTHAFTTSLVTSLLIIFFLLCIYSYGPRAVAGLRTRLRGPSSEPVVSQPPLPAIPDRPPAEAPAIGQPAAGGSSSGQKHPIYAEVKKPPSPLEETELYQMESIP